MRILNPKQKDKYFWFNLRNNFIAFVVDGGDAQCQLVDKVLVYGTRFTFLGRNVIPQNIPQYTNFTEGDPNDSSDYLSFLTQLMDPNQADPGFDVNYPFVSSLYDKSTIVSDTLHVRTEYYNDWWNKRITKKLTFSEYSSTLYQSWISGKVPNPHWGSQPKGQGFDPLVNDKDFRGNIADPRDIAKWKDQGLPSGQKIPRSPGKDKNPRMVTGIEKYVKSLNRSRSESVRPKKDRSVSKDSNRPIGKKKNFKENTPGKNPSLFSQTELSQLMETLAILTKKGGQSCKTDEVPDEKRDRRDPDERQRGKRNHVTYPRGNMRN